MLTRNGAAAKPPILALPIDQHWSDSVAVKIFIYRLLDKLPAEAWILDLKDQIYLSEDERRLLGSSARGLEMPAPKDSNGQILAAGDSVTLIKISM